MSEVSTYRDLRDTKKKRPKSPIKTTSKVSDEDCFNTLKLWVESNIKEGFGISFTSEQLSEKFGIDQKIVRRAIVMLKLNPPVGKYVKECNRNPRAVWPGEYGWYTTLYLIKER